MYASLQKTTCLFFLNDPRSLQRLFYWPKGGGKRSTWLKNIMDFPVTTIQRSILVAAVLRKPHAVRVMSSLAACALWRSCYLLLSGIRARTGHPHQPLHPTSPTPWGPQLLAIDQSSRAVKEKSPDMVLMLTGFYDHLLPFGGQIKTF